MKRVILLFFAFLLVSCAKEQDYTVIGRSYLVTIDDVEGRLSISEDYVRFEPTVPEGLCITLDDKGGNISYKELVFEGEAPKMTIVAPLYEALEKDEINLIFDNETLCEIQGEGFRITIHKELSD